MKRFLITLCVAATVVAMSVPALAADAGQSASYYPIDVEEYMEGDSHRIKKTYQLSLADDPASIPTDDFVLDGRLYYLLDMTRKDEIGVDVQTYTETVTQASDTNKLETILQRLDAEMEVATEDGYTGLLRLDHTSVQVTTDGYATKTQNLSATRTYPNLSDADLSLIPKTIEDNGQTLTLADVQWADSSQTEADSVVVRWCATASYTGTSSTRYATGYTVTADYVGEVTKTDCSVMTYTAIFGSMEAPEESDGDSESAATDMDDAGTPVHFLSLRRTLSIGCVVLILAAGGLLLFRKFRKRS